MVGSHAHHRHAPGRHGRAFAIGIALNLGFVVLEAACGILAGSMALVADAAHNLGDVFALSLAWGASVLAVREPSPRFTYGLGGSSILAALLNGALLLVATGAIAWEALQRLADPAPVAAGAMVGVAFAGIVVNGATAWLFARDRARDANVRGAFLHMMADAAVSAGVVLAGVGVMLTGWLWLDPIAGLAIAIVIVASTWGLLRDALGLAMAAVPSHIDPAQVRRYLGGLAGVAEVHDLHIWAMSTTETALTVHLVMPGGHPGDGFIAEVTAALAERFHVAHPTIQIETGDGTHRCPLAPDHVI